MPKNSNGLKAFSGNKMWFFSYTDFNLGHKIFDGFYGKKFLQVGFSNYPLIFQNHTLFILGFWNALFWLGIQTTDIKFSARTYHNPNHAKKKRVEAPMFCPMSHDRLIVVCFVSRFQSQPYSTLVLKLSYEICIPKMIAIPVFCFPAELFWEWE